MPRPDILHRCAAALGLSLVIATLSSCGQVGSLFLRMPPVQFPPLAPTRIAKPTPIFLPAGVTLPAPVSATAPAPAVASRATPAVATGLPPAGATQP